MRRLAVLAYCGTVPRAASDIHPAKQNFIRENDFYERKRLTSSVLQQKKNSDLAGGVAGLSGANWSSLRRQSTAAAFLARRTPSLKT